MADAARYKDNAATTATLLEAGIMLMRRDLKRRHPEKTDSEVDALLAAWLRRADDPIPGDTAGPVRIRKRIP